MGHEAMATAVVLVGLNIVDALLARMNLKLGGFELNPLVSPFVANLVARGLAAIAIILILNLIRKENLLWWLNLLMLGLICWNLTDYWVSSLVSIPS